MELRHLRYFVAVAEELNVRRAAARLHIAAPPLSLQIRRLEAEIGVDLFSRVSRRMKLTDAGRAFLENARQLLANAQDCVAAARRAASGEHGHLSIGYFTPAGFRVFPRVLPIFKQRFPQAQLEFHSLSISSQLESLRRDQLDVGFVFLPIPTEEFDVRELVLEPLVAVIPRGHRLASLASISISDLSNEPLIVPSRAITPETYLQLHELFLKAGAVLNVAYELDNALAMIGFVAMGAGCTLLPDYLQGIHQDGVVHRPIRPPNVVNTLAMVKKKGRKGLAEQFYQCVIDNLPPPEPTTAPRKKAAHQSKA